MVTTIPIFITLTRILITPFIVWAILQNHTYIALYLFIFAGITDFLDGLCARVMKKCSALGALLDACADKILVLSIILALAAHQTLCGITLIPALIILWRELFIATIRHLPVKKTNQPNMLCRIKTTAQMFALLLFLCTLCFETCIGYANLMLWLASIITLLSSKHHIHKLSSLHKH
ncbi:MAG: CDP-diacylglycerol--glycerol-3-phosphate 3-phosphatidyltransferase [Alphaproteobacteria bacterium]|nr:CDP-diacylglycerol--glycerol-3-phosphate 3-phosphatidyltransferase [Alphaproteobacteria bacterium]